MTGAAGLKSRLRELGISPKRSLGQNFLVNTSVIDKTVGATLAVHAAEVVEIGPGLGALTEPLLASAARLRVVELDRRLADYWRSRGLTVVEEDALVVDWSRLALKDPTVLVSNLPYQISTHLVVDRCFGPRELKWMVLMFQKEVAQRLAAKPRTGDYGLLSVMAQVHFEIERVADAAPGDFYPPPKVASRVLKLSRRPGPGPGPSFLRFVKAAFAFRRKFLLKNLSVAVDKAGQDRLTTALSEVGHTAKARAEDLSPAEFVGLFQRVYEHKDHK